MIIVLAPFLGLSHPVRVRGLKQGSEGGDYDEEESHPVRVRGLKPDCAITP